MADDQLVRKIQALSAQRARVKDQAANVQTVNGLFMVKGSGEAATDVLFPIKFIERPLMNFGAELDPNSFALITGGSYPEYHVVVGRFIYEAPAAEPTKRLFTGAQLLIKTVGPLLMNTWIHWAATGKAITNPST